MKTVIERLGGSGFVRSLEPPKMPEIPAVSPDSACYLLFPGIKIQPSQSFAPDFFIAARVRPQPAVSAWHSISRRKLRKLSAGNCDAVSQFHSPGRCTAACAGSSRPGTIVFRAATKLGGRNAE
jgi:hypothetical protein